MSTCAEMENMRYELIERFYDALRLVRAAEAAEALNDRPLGCYLPGHAAELENSADNASVIALQFAADRGLNCDDPWFEHLRTHKSTPQEILVEGLRLALERCQPIEASAAEAKVAEAKVAEAIEHGRIHSEVVWLDFDFGDVAIKPILDRLNAECDGDAECGGDGDYCERYEFWADGPSDDPEDMDWRIHVRVREAS